MHAAVESWVTDRMRWVTATSGDERPTSNKQDAVRLLLLIHTASEELPLQLPLEAPHDAVAVLHSQVLLQKLDFWLRNPDYLANELLNRYEIDRNLEDLGLAEQILDSDEPEVRRYPMLRYLFGAYEPLDDALALLAAPRLVLKRRTRRGARVPVDYYLTEQGRAVALKIVADVPELGYYVDRARLVIELADGRRGSVLRDIQYLQREYAEAALGERIGGIAGRARQRLSDLRNDTSTAAAS